ncbi:MAG: ROK family transcriptional regulator [Spirochaetales bacterium]|nr:ROK family transcriptional regulator [Spirochaetales bacterium]
MAAIKRTKIINRARIMREIWMNREISRIDIARSLSLDKSTISNNVNELLEMGVIVESSEGTSGPQGGRKPVNIKLNKNFGCVLGLEIGPESFTAVAVDLEGEILYSRFEKLLVNGSCFMEKFSEIVDSIASELERKNLSLLGVGVGVSGVVNSNEGIIKYSIPLEITSDYDFYTEVANRFDVPIFIDNDANASVWGELAFHRRKDLKDFIFLLLELRDIDSDSVLRDRVGVGIGLVINGNVHYGHDYSAGEFRSIIRKKDSLGQFSLTEDEQRRMEDSPELMEAFLHELGAHVGLLVNTFNLTHIILGGSFERYDKQAVSIFEEEIRLNWPYPYPYEVDKNIWLSSFGDQAVAYGAAGMVLHKLFSDIEIMENQPGFRAHREGFRVF